MTEQQLEKWEESERRIDEKIASSLGKKKQKWLLPNFNEQEAGEGGFYKHMMYVVNSFLEDDETRELFIQIPVLELANKANNGNDAKQTQRFCWLTGTIVACLQMATVEQMRNNVLIPRDVDYDNTTHWFNEGDCFLAEREGSTCLYATAIKDKGRTRLRFKNQMNPKKAFDQCIPGSFVRISEIPNQEKRGAGIIKENVSRLQRIPPLNTQYESAALVSLISFSPINENVVNSNYLNNTVKFVSDYNGIEGFDIVVVCGDEKYSNCAQAYRNSEAKKIIYIGTEKPFNGNIKSYPFTYREVYRYFSTHKYQYDEPTCITLPFNWLDERRSELDTLLNQCGQDDDWFTDGGKNSIERRLIFLFSRYDFDASQLQRIKNEFSDEDAIIEGLLYDLNTNVSDNTIEQLVDQLTDWIQSLDFNDTNPKRVWLNDHKATLVIGKGDSYDRKTKGLCGYNNHIVLDNLAVCKKDKRYPTILQNHLFAKVTALYYRHEEYALRTLCNYINEEERCYTNEYRRCLETSIDIPVQSPEVLPDWLDHFFDDEYVFNETISNQTQRCRVTFKDKTVDNIYGDVIVDLGENGYKTINIRDAEIGMRIAYYTPPDGIFDTLIAASEKYAKDWNSIIEASRLWKQKLIGVYDQKINQGLTKENAILDISNNSGLPEERVKAYCKENNNKFLLSRKEMKKVLTYLYSLGLITESDRKDIMRAKYLNSKIPKEFGAALKKELYDSFLQDDPDTKLLDGISEKSGLSKEYIFSTAIVSDKIINKIEILNSNE